LVYLKDNTKKKDDLGRWRPLYFPKFWGRVERKIIIERGDLEKLVGRGHYKQLLF